MSPDLGFILTINLRYFHNKKNEKKVDLTYVFSHPDSSYTWRMSRDLGIILILKVCSFEFPIAHGNT